MSSRETLLVVAAVSAVVHLLAIGSLPLIVTPDGAEYIQAGIWMLDRGEIWPNPFRTPGYPALLAWTFSLFGRNPTAILVVQHGLAWASTVLVTAIACRFAGALPALAAGLLFALDPWSLMLSTYALSETAVAFAVVVTSAVVLLRPGAGLRHAFLVGALLTTPCFVRPALQAFAPFAGLAWVLRAATTPRTRAGLGAVVLAGFAITSAPWLLYNHSRGTDGFARGSSFTLWYGVTFSGLLDLDYPIDERTRASYEANAARHLSDDSIMRTVVETDARNDAEQDRRLGDWAKASIRKRPLGYLKSAASALLWALNCGIEGKPPMYDELPFFADRLGWDGRRIIGAPASNFQGAGRFPGWESFASSQTGGGVLQQYLSWWGARHVRGVPQVPLFLAALVACGICVRDRQWPLLILFAGSLALVAVHCALLMPVARYTITGWSLWYVALAIVLREVAARIWTDAPALAIPPP
ncbi:MAG: hypothetical protein ACREQL_08160 [Candidatus Binatia bacterium]